MTYYTDTFIERGVRFHTEVKQPHPLTFEHGEGLYITLFVLTRSGKLKGWRFFNSHHEGLDEIAPKKYALVKYILSIIVVESLDNRLIDVYTHDGEREVEEYLFSKYIDDETKKISYK